MPFMLIDTEDAAAFDRDGYLIKRGLFSAEKWPCATG